MKLLILRHAIAEEAPLEADFGRRLTPEGRGKLRRVLRAHLQRFAPPSLVYTSPLVRARQTAAVAARAWGCPVVVTPALRPGGQAWSWLSQCGEESLAVVGHEPDLSLLAAAHLGLTGRPPLAFKKSGMAYFEGPPGEAQLRWLISPRWLV